MSSTSATAHFFTNGNSKQFEYVLKLYPQVLRLKAEIKAKKPEELIKLDDWYQNELPKKLKQRGKDAHMVHEELVQTMKWKQTRGKFYPQLNYLIKVNTPRAVMAETKKAFRKLPNLEAAITALSNLKGVGTTMASALLAAAAPESAPFMADECLMAIPDIEGIDYTTKEYLNFVNHIQTTCDRLRAEKDSNIEWTAHKVELALWTHYVASDMKPELLENIPAFTNNSSHELIITNSTTTTNNSTATNGVPPSIEASDESNLEPAQSTPQNGNNGKCALDSLDESTRSEDSCEKAVTPIGVSDEATNDSDSQSSIKRSLESENNSADEPISTNNEPESKKLKCDAE